MHHAPHNFAVRWTYKDTKKTKTIADLPPDF